MDGSPSGAGNTRRSGRARSKPCEYWRNETKKLEYVQDVLPTSAVAKEAKGALLDESSAQPTSVRRCLDEVFAPASGAAEAQRGRDGVKGKAAAPKGDGAAEQKTGAGLPSARPAEKDRTAATRQPQALKVSAYTSPGKSLAPPKAGARDASPAHDQKSPTRGRKGATAKKVAKATNPSEDVMPPRRSDRHTTAIAALQSCQVLSDSQTRTRPGAQGPGLPCIDNKATSPAQRVLKPVQKAAGVADATRDRPRSSPSTAHRLEPLTREIAYGSLARRGTANHKQMPTRAAPPVPDSESEPDERLAKRPRKAQVESLRTSAAERRPGAAAPSRQAPGVAEHGGGTRHKHSEAGTRASAGAAPKVKKAEAASAAAARIGAAGVSGKPSDRPGSGRGAAVPTAPAAAPETALAPAGGQQAVPVIRGRGRPRKVRNIPAVEQAPAAHLPPEAPVQEPSQSHALKPPPPKVADAGGIGAAAAPGAKAATRGVAKEVDAGAAAVPAASAVVSPRTPANVGALDTSPQPTRTLSLAAAAALAGLTAAKRSMQGTSSALQQGKPEQQPLAAEMPAQQQPLAAEMPAQQQPQQQQSQQQQSQQQQSQQSQQQPQQQQQLGGPAQVPREQLPQPEPQHQQEEPKGGRFQRRKTGKKRKRIAAAADAAIAAADAEPAGDGATAPDATVPLRSELQAEPRKQLEQQQEQQPQPPLPGSLVARELQAASKVSAPEAVDAVFQEKALRTSQRSSLKAGCGGLDGRDAQPRPSTAGPAPRGAASLGRSASIGRAQAYDGEQQPMIAVAGGLADGLVDSVGGEARVAPSPAAINLPPWTQPEGAARHDAAPLQQQQEQPAFSGRARQQEHDQAGCDAGGGVVQPLGPGGCEAGAGCAGWYTAAPAAGRRDAVRPADLAFLQSCCGIAPPRQTFSVADSVAQSHAYDHRGTGGAVNACSPGLRPFACGPCQLSHGLSAVAGASGAPAGAEEGPAAPDLGTFTRQGEVMEAGQRLPRRPVPPPPLFNAPTAADSEAKRLCSEAAGQLRRGDGAGDGHMGSAAFQDPFVYGTRGDREGCNIFTNRVGGLIEGVRRSCSGVGTAGVKGISAYVVRPNGRGSPMGHSARGFQDVEPPAAPAPAAPRQAPVIGNADGKLYVAASAGGVGSTGIRPRVMLATRMRVEKDPYDMPVDMDEQEGVCGAHGVGPKPDDAPPQPPPGLHWQQPTHQQHFTRDDMNWQPEPCEDAGAWRVGRIARHIMQATPQGPQRAREEEGPTAELHGEEPWRATSVQAGYAPPGECQLTSEVAAGSQSATIQPHVNEWRNTPAQRVCGMRSSYDGNGSGDTAHDMDLNREAQDASLTNNRRQVPTVPPGPEDWSPRSPRDPRVWPPRRGVPSPSSEALCGGGTALPAHALRSPRMPRGQQRDASGAYGMYGSGRDNDDLDDQAMQIDQEVLEGAGAAGGVGADTRPQHPASRYPQRHQELCADEAEVGGHHHHHQRQDKNEEHVWRLREALVMSHPPAMTHQDEHPERFGPREHPGRLGQRPSGFSAAQLDQVAADCTGGGQGTVSCRDLPHPAGSVQRVTSASAGPPASARGGCGGSSWGGLRGQPGHGQEQEQRQRQQAVSGLAFSGAANAAMKQAQARSYSHLQQADPQQCHHQQQHQPGQFVAPAAPGSGQQHQQQQQAATETLQQQQPQAFRVPVLRTGGLRSLQTHTRSHDDREAGQAQSQQQHHSQLGRQPVPAGSGGAGLLRPAANPLGQPSPPQQQQPALGSCAAQTAASVSVSVASQKIFRALHRSEQMAQRLKARMHGFAQTEEEGWTLEQHQKLQVAYFKVDPTHPQFWKEVARHVPGRTAGECFLRVFASGKDAEERALLRKVMPKMRRLQPAGPATSGRPVTLAAARKYSQKMHERDQLERMARLALGPGAVDESSDSAEDGDEGEGPREAAGRGGGGGAGQQRRLRQRRPQPQLPGDPTELRRLLDDLQKKQQADRFVTSFLNRQGGWVKWHKAARAAQERMYGGQAAAARQPPGAVPTMASSRRGSEAGGGSHTASAAGVGAGGSSNPQHSRGGDDPLARYIRRILVQDETRKVREAWREDDEAEGLEYEEYGSEDENDVDADDEEEEAKLRRYLVAEGLIGPDGMPVLS